MNTPSISAESLHRPPVPLSGLRSVVQQGGEGRQRRPLQPPRFDLFWRRGLETYLSLRDPPSYHLGLIVDRYA